MEVKWDLRSSSSWFLVPSVLCTVRRQRGGVRTWYVRYSDTDSTERLVLDTRWNGRLCSEPEGIGETGLWSRIKRDSNNQKNREGPRSGPYQRRL